MKQVVQNYKSGELRLLEVPPPRCNPGGVLVRTAYSLISTGTELMKVGEAGMSLLAKARARPDQVAKVMQSVASAGLVATYHKVNNKLDSYTPLGYSLCGVVEQVGYGIDDVTVGDLVACAGNEHALHSELNWVPRNLYGRVPEGLPAEQAAFATVGSIAMQGVRRGESQLGEVALVIGLGLIGQLVVQLLVASGVRVVGVDLDPDRCVLAERSGALVCCDPGSAVLDAAVADVTGGHGVDQVYVAAGGSSNQPVELAARLSRDRGRVVDIGKTRLDLPWNAYYEKELDVRFSRSYGPGRYDASYELEGRDYPIGYVRWTERRNIECFLDLMKRDRIDVTPLISRVAPFDQAVRTYEQLNSGELKAVAVLFRYPDPTDADVAAPDRAAAEIPPVDEALATGSAPADLAGPESRPISPTTAAATAATGAPAQASRSWRRPLRPASAAVAPGRPLRLAFVGAGNYASSMLLPHLAGREDVVLGPVVTTSALSASNAVRKFGFATASTDLDAVLGDSSIDAVFVVTRHSSHAALTELALRAGKTVFVEKPLAVSQADLDRVLVAVAETGNDRLQVGFNRRFAPLLRQAKERFGRRVGPASVRYLVNAGSLDQNSWYRRQEREGTRFEGEGGHFVDTVSWLLDDEPTSVFACATGGNRDLQVVLRYTDGSVASINYTTTGATAFPKETLDLTADGKVLRFDDFQRASVYGPSRWSSPRIPRGRDKGQRLELDAFLDAVRSGGPMPVPVGSLVATTLATLAVGTSMGSGAPVRLRDRSPEELGAR